MTLSLSSSCRDSTPQIGYSSQGLSTHRAAASFKVKANKQAGCFHSRLAYLRLPTPNARLEQIPQILVIALVVVLHLLRLDKRAQQARAAVGVAVLHFVAQQIGRPLRRAEVRKSVVDVIGQEALGLAQARLAADAALQSGAEQRIHHQIGVGTTERTSMRTLRSLPIGMRIIEPRHTGEAMIWLGDSKCGSSRR